MPLRIVNPTATPGSVSLMGTPSYGKLTNIEKARDIDRIGDRSSLELNLNLNTQEIPGLVKKNVMGVKLIGMEGGTLRRPSLQVIDLSRYDCYYNSYCDDDDNTYNCNY